LQIPVQVAKSAVKRLMQHGLLELQLNPSPALAVTEPGKTFVYEGMPLPERSETVWYLIFTATWRAFLGWPPKRKPIHN